MASQTSTSTLASRRRASGPLETLSVRGSLARVRQSERLSINYGSELDLQLQGKYRRFTGTLKYADYDAAASTPLAVRDTRKFWAQLDSPGSGMRSRIHDRRLRCAC